MNVHAVGVMFNQNEIAFNENTGLPYADSQGRIQVPLRLSMETIGAAVEWDDVNKLAVIKRGETTVNVPLGKKFIEINDIKVETDTEAASKNGRIYLPIRAVAEAFGIKVFWDADTKYVVMSTNSTNMYTVNGQGEYLGFRWLKGHELQDRINIYYEKEGYMQHAAWKLKKDIDINEKIEWIDEDGKKKISSRKGIYDLLDAYVLQSKLFAMENKKYISSGLSNPYVEKMDYIRITIPSVYEDWADTGPAREYDVSNLIMQYDNGFN